MGRLEKQIIIGALALVGVLLTVVVLKGLQPRDDSSVDLGAPAAWERPTPKLDAFGGAGDTSLTLDADFRPAGSRAGDGGTAEPAVLKPEPPPMPLPVKEEPVVMDEPEPPSADGTRTYTVKQGEILGLIAQRELGSVRHVPAILDLNPQLDRSGDNIREGMVLVMPSRASLESRREAPPAQRPAELVGVRTHEVVSGDSLWSISMKYYGSGLHVDRIVAANDKLSSEDTTLVLGWTLVIPE